MQPDSLTVDEAPSGQRFDLRRGDERIGWIDVRPEADGRVLAFTHTEIDARLRSNGLGAVLVRGALDAVRDRGGEVLPRCSFVRDFIAANPEYVALVPVDARSQLGLAG